MRLPGPVCESRDEVSADSLGFSAEISPFGVGVGREVGTERVGGFDGEGGLARPA